MQVWDLHINEIDCNITRDFFIATRTEYTVPKHYWVDAQVLLG